MKRFIDTLIDNIVVYQPLSLIRRPLSQAERKLTKKQWEKKGLINPVYSVQFRTIKTPVVRESIKKEVLDERRASESWT